MPSFGLNTEGYLAPTLREIQSDIESDQLADISSQLDVSPSSPDGMRNAVFSRQDASIWELGAAVYEMMDPDKAEGTSLINLCKLSGTVPHAATYTIVGAMCTGTAGTILAPDVVYASVTGKPTVRFTPATPFTFPGTGSFLVTFRSELSGPVACPAGTLSVVAVGPPAGSWTVVTNPADGNVGAPADDEPTLRRRRVAELSAAGSGSVPALQTDIAQAKNAAGQPLVSSVRVFENSTDTVDAYGRPRKSIEVLVTPNGTTLPGELGAFIWQKSGGGPTRYGLSVDTFTDTQTGEVRNIAYSIATAFSVYVRVYVTAGDGYPGDTITAAAILAELNAGVLPGAPLAKIWDVETAAQQPGVTNVTLVQQGTAPAPTGVVDLAVGARQYISYVSVVVAH